MIYLAKHWIDFFLYFWKFRKLRDENNKKEVFGFNLRSIFDDKIPVRSYNWSKLSTNH